MSIKRFFEHPKHVLHGLYGSPCAHLQGAGDLWELQTLTYIGGSQKFLSGTPHNPALVHIEASNCSAFALHSALTSHLTRDYMAMAGEIWKGEVMGSMHAGMIT